LKIHNTRKTMRLFPIILIPLLSLPLFAQNEEVPAIGAPPGVVPPVVPPQPAPGNQANLGDTLIVEKIEYLQLTGDILADLYSKWTGRRVIVASSAADAELKFIQSASPQNPLTYRQAAELLKKTATIENFIFVPDDTDPNLDFLTLASAGLKPTQRSIETYTENDKLPEGDAVITYVMALDYLKPDEAQRVFLQVVGQLGAFGSITTGASSVIITENTSLIRSFVDLKKVIDKPSTEVATRFITVKYADVTELATTLNELLGQQQSNSTTNTAGVVRTQAQGGNQAVNGNNIEAVLSNGAAAAGGSSSGEPTPVQIIPDARTNRIFAMGRPVDLLFVEGLVREFDTESDQRNFLRRKLKFLAVADFLPIAGDALTRAFTGTGTGTGTGDAGAATQGSGAGNRQQSNNNLFNGGGSQGSSSFGGSSGGAGGSSASRGSALSDPQVNSAPESLLIGRTLLVADNITNSIVVQGPPSGVEIIEKLLDQVDVKADQVMISTVFGQLSLGDSTSTGVDWIKAFRGNNNGGFAGSNITGGVGNGLDPSGFFTPAGGSTTNPATVLNGLLPGQTGLSLYGKIGNSLSAYVNLLSSSSDFTVLSRPSIFTANNQKGTISSGRRIAIPTNSNSFSGGGVSTNIEYRDVVLKLEVIPLVNSEDEITLQIALVSDDVIGQSDFIDGIGSVPIIGTRELLTTVTVPNNQTIILGGLITTNDTENVTGIPILSDIPGLGRLFSTKTKGVDRDELMIFIQPSIVNSGNSLDRVQADMDSRYNVSDDARKFADGSVLPSLDSIQEKGGALPAAVQVEDDGTNFNRQSIRPFHRR
jgi:general secretion pathway protein D